MNASTLDGADRTAGRPSRARLRRLAFRATLIAVACTVVVVLGMVGPDGDPPSPLLVDASSGDATDGGDPKSALGTEPLTFLPQLLDQADDGSWNLLLSEAEEPVSSSEICLTFEIVNVAKSDSCGGPHYGEVQVPHLAIDPNGAVPIEGVGGILNGSAFVFGGIDQPVQEFMLLFEDGSTQPILPTRHELGSFFVYEYELPPLVSQDLDLDALPTTTPEISLVSYLPEASDGTSSAWRTLVRPLSHL